MSDAPHFANPPVAELDRPWANAFDALLALRGLEDDWDGQGAAAPPAAVVDTALRIASDFRAAQMPEPDRVIAGANGTVFFEWFGTIVFKGLRSNDYLEVEVTAPGQAEGRMVSKDTNQVTQFLLDL